MDEPKTNNRRRPVIVCDDPLLTPREAAAEVDIGLSTLWRDLRVGNFPTPYRVTPRAPRWRRSELRAWIETRRMKSAT